MKEIIKIINDNADGSETFMVNPDVNIHTSRKDIYIKKGGKVDGVIFLTKKAQKIAKESKVPNHYPETDQYRFDIVTKQAIQILTWALTHRLSVDSEVPMTVEPKEIKR